MMNSTIRRVTARTQAVVHWCGEGTHLPYCICVFVYLWACGESSSARSHSIVHRMQRRSSLGDAMPNPAIQEVVYSFAKCLCGESSSHTGKYSRQAVKYFTNRM